MSFNAGPPTGSILECSIRYTPTLCAFGTGMWIKETPEGVVESAVLQIQSASNFARRTETSVLSG